MSASKILADFYISIIILKFWTTFGSAFSIPYKFYFMDMIALHISLSVVFIIFDSSILSIVAVVSALQYVFTLVIASRDENFTKISGDEYFDFIKT